MKKVYLSDIKTITMEEAEKPKPFANRVLIKTKAVGICGTDVHGYMGETIFGKMFPFHIGHEVAGVVEDIGPDCREIQVGDYVVIDPLIACGVCENCRSGKSNHCAHSTTIGRTGPGGFSDYILTPETSVYKFNKKLDFHTACLAEPLACVLHGIERAGVSLGHTVLIKGAGAIGQMQMVAARLAGASVVGLADLNELKLAKAKEMGADFVLNPAAPDYDEKLRAIAPKGFDVVIDCTGAAVSVASNIPYVKNAGTMLIFGVCPKNSEVSYHPHEVYIREITILGTFAFPKETLLKSLAFLEEGCINAKELISAILPRDQLEQALLDVHAGKHDGKVVIDTEM